MAPEIVPFPDCDIWSFLFERKTKPFSDHQVLYTCSQTGRSYTYADVERTARQFGTGLLSQWSWEKNDVLTLFTPNCIDTPAVTWGCHWAGGIVSLANPGNNSIGLSQHLKHSGSKALITQNSCLPTALKAAAEVGLPRSRILLIEDTKNQTGQVRHFTSLLDPSECHRPQLMIRPEVDLAYLVYTSGTTGLAKGAMVTHSNVVAHLVMANTVDGKMLEPGIDKVLAVLPYYHIYGLMFLVHLPLYIGVESVTMAEFEIAKFCSVIQRHKITYTYVAPPIVLHLAKNPIIDSYDLSSLRMMVSGAAPLSKELIIAIYKRLSIPVRQAYGLSETTSATHLQTWATWQTAMGSVGPPLPNLITMFVDSDGKSVPTGENGELWIKGPTVFKGYHNNPEETSKAITPDGYFKTGDIGFQDMEGNMFITDRIKELIKYKGSQVAPAELEGILASHPKVKDVAVIGVQVKAIESEVPMAFVVPAQGVVMDETSAEELVNWTAARVVKHKKLRGGIVWIDEIPKSTTGKILRQILKTNIKVAKPMAATKFIPTSKLEKL